MAKGPQVYFSTYGLPDLLDKYAPPTFVRTKIKENSVQKENNKRVINNMGFIAGSWMYITAEATKKAIVGASKKGLQRRNIKETQQEVTKSMKVRDKLEHQRDRYHITNSIFPLSKQPPLDFFFLKKSSAVWRARVV